MPFCSSCRSFRNCSPISSLFLPRSFRVGKSFSFLCFIHPLFTVSLSQRVGFITVTSLIWTEVKASAADQRDVCVNIDADCIPNLNKTLKQKLVLAKINIFNLHFLELYRPTNFVFFCKFLLIPRDQMLP